MSQPLQTAMDGLVLGSTYALLALGFALVFGVLGVLNVAHADFAVLGAYIALISVDAFGGGLLTALAAAIVTGVVSGLMLQFAVLRRLRTDQHLSAFIATLGVAFVLQYGIARIFGPRDRTFDPLISTNFRTFGGVTISDPQLLVIGVTGATMAGLLLWLRKSSTGRQIRAVAESETVASILGVHVYRVRAFTICIATSMATVAGVLLTNLNGAVEPFLGADLALRMFVIVLVAGMGSIGAPVLVAFGLGLTESITVVYVGAQWQNFAGFFVLLLVLLLRPQGLAGRMVRLG